MGWTQGSCIVRWAYILAPPGKYGLTVVVAVAFGLPPRGGDTACSQITLGNVVQRKHGGG